MIPENPYETYAQRVQRTREVRGISLQEAERIVRGQVLHERLYEAKQGRDFDALADIVGELVTAMYPEERGL